MARKLNAKTKEVETKPSNVTDATRKEFFDRALAAKNDLDKAVEEASSARGIYRAVLKEAKKAGVPQKAIIWHIDNRKRDPDEVKRELQEIDWMGRAIGAPIGTQFGLYTDDELPERDPEAFSKGKKAGLAGKGQADNPYEAGSAEASGWESGRMAGQSDIVRKMGPKNGANPEDRPAA